MGKKNDSSCQEANKDSLSNRRRERLPDERRSINHHFTIHTNEGVYDGYIILGFYDDGRPGEVFIKVAKIGSLLSGVLDALATSVSIGLQTGVPMESFVSKFIHQRFDLSEGYTDNPDIPTAKSILDYIFKWLGQKCCGMESERIQTSDD